MKELVNPEVIEEVAETATTSPFRNFVSSKPGKVTGVALATVATAGIAYVAYRGIKWLINNHNTKQAAKAKALGEKLEQPVAEPSDDNPAA